MSTGFNKILSTGQKGIEDNFKKYITIRNFQTFILFIIILSVIYYAIKQLIKIYKNYPRAFSMKNYLDISGKYDKSTGLDLELADILSKSLTDYLTIPSKFIHKINYKSQFIINPKILEVPLNNKCGDDYEDCDNDNELIGTSISPGNTYSEYLKKHIFNYFLRNNEFYEILRNFVDEGIDIYNNNEINIDETIYNKPEFKNKMFEKYYNETKKTNKINNYIIGFLKSINRTDPSDRTDIDVSLNTTVVQQFINSLKTTSSSSRWDDKLDKNYEKIYNFFNEILTTTSSNLDYNKNIKEFYRNLFFRNVLYILITENTSDISLQLDNLENKNILSYIDPEIYKDNELKLLTNYGKYLYLEDTNKNITSFKDILKRDSNLPSNIISKIRDTQIIDGISTKDDIKTSVIDEIISLLPSDEEFDNENIKYFYDKQFIFNRLKKYKNSIYNNDYEKHYLRYKELLEKKEIDSGNNLLNKIYNIKSTTSNTSNRINSINGITDIIGITGSTFNPNDIYNINKVDTNDRYILEIYNHLIIFQNFIENINTIINTTNNDNENYDNFIEYFYHLEKYTTSLFYNSIKNKEEFLFKKEDKPEFIKYFTNIFDKLLYLRDKDLINSVLFSTLSLYNSDNINEAKEDLLNLSKFYMSFVEIKLADNFIKDVMTIKERRTGYNIWNDYFIGVVWKYYFNDLIINKYWSGKSGGDWNLSKIKRETSPMWRSFVNKIENKCTWFNKKESDLFKMSCSDDSFVIEPFLGPLLGLPKMMANFFKNIPELIFMFIRLFIILNPIGIIVVIINLGFTGFLTVFIKIIIYFLILCIIVIGSLPGIVSAIGLPFFPIGTIFGVCGIVIFLIFAIYSPNDSLLTFGESITFMIGIVIIFILSLIKSLFIFIIIFILLIICSIITLGDWISNNWFSKNLYKYFIACENSPFAWYKNSRYDLENKCSRGFLCNLNCGTNYRLSENKMYCTKSPTNVPYYCPQPLLYKNYKDEKIKGKSSVISFFIRNNPKILLYSEEKKSEFLFNYKKDKKEYYNSCNIDVSSEENKHKNIIGKNVCAYGYNVKDKNIKNKIKEICKQTYCSNGKYENFCYKYNDLDTKTDIKIFNDDNKFIESIKNILFIITLLTICGYTIIKLDETDEIINIAKKIKKKANDKLFNLLK